MRRRSRLEPLQPQPVSLRPWLARVAKALAQQKASDVLSAADRVASRLAARPHQIPHRLVHRVRDPHRRQLLRTQQLRQAQTVAAVRLHTRSRATRRHRWRHHLARHAGFAVQLPVEPVAARPGFLAHHQLPRPFLQLPHQAIDRYRLVRYLAPVPNLAVRQRLGQSDVDVFAVFIQTNLQPMLRHERSPMHEARRRPIRRNPRYGMRRGRPLAHTQDIWTELAPEGPLRRTQESRCSLYPPLTPPTSA